MALDRAFTLEPIRHAAAATLAGRIYRRRILCKDAAVVESLINK